MDMADGRNGGHLAGDSVTDAASPDAVAAPAPGSQAPAMPAHDRGKLTRQPAPWVERGSLEHSIALQRRPEREGGASCAR
jgi:hypothetical protein